MPAKSRSQFRKMFILRKNGEITQAQLDEFTKGGDYKKLPKKKAQKRTKKGGGKKHG